MITREISETAGALGRATGHYTWKWNDHDAFSTDGLTEELAGLIINDIEALDGRVSRTERDGKVFLTIGYDDAVNYIEAEAHDRAHAPEQHDTLQEFLALNHPQFVWQRKDGGFVGHGYNLADEEALKQPFLKAGIRLKPAEADTNHDGTTHGLFISENAVQDLMQQQRGAQRG